MTLEEQLFAVGTIILAAFLSMVIGLDRENRQKDAGMRTHMLVGIGACLLTLLSRWAFPGGDPSRVAANVVTGIGFLGAGIIYRSENKVHDLTTAASIWVTAAVGMAVGVGLWFLALCVTLVIWVTLDVLRRFKH